MRFLRRKPRADEAEQEVAYIPHDCITNKGLDLEREVRSAYGFTAEWDLHQISDLLLAVKDRSLYVKLEYVSPLWLCSIGDKPIPPTGGDYVKETSYYSPATALAKGALAASKWFPLET